MKNKSFLLIIAIMMIAMYSVAQVTDKDGNTYKTVKIGTQEWMAENLNVSHFRNGDVITEAKTTEEWKKARDDHQPAWCYYNNDSLNGKKFNKLYNWYAVSDQRGLAPYKWHVPSKLEWTDLIDYLGGVFVAGGKMKYTLGWESNGNGTNETGFAGLPGGACSTNGIFYGIGGYGNWWSSSEYQSDKAFDYILYSTDALLNTGPDYKSHGYSIRCLRD